MQPLFKIGQVVKGSKSSYTIISGFCQTVFLARDENRRKIVLKTVEERHWRLQNEAEILERLQKHTRFVRPIVDKIQEPEDPPAICLAYLDSDLRNESRSQRLNRFEIKYVAKHVLGALKILHEENLVHTDVKLDNVLVNHGGSGERFGEVQLADFGGTVSADSKYAKGGFTVGAPIWRSPEVLIGIPWGTPTDIWSFGTMVRWLSVPYTAGPADPLYLQYIISLINGNDFHIFDAGNDGISFDDEDFFFHILNKHLQFFGPFKVTYSEIADEEATQIVAYAMETLPAEQIKPFKNISKSEICQADNDFLSKIMKLDPRERPTAENLLADEWFDA